MKRRLAVLVPLAAFCCIMTVLIALLLILFEPQIDWGLPTPQREPSPTRPWTWTPTATRRPHYEFLSCYDCEAEGMEVNLWAYDGDKRTRIVGSLPHGTRVVVLDTDWSDAEGRYYHRVEGDGEKGWVSENFLTPNRP